MDLPEEKIQEPKIEEKVEVEMPMINDINEIIKEEVNLEPIVIEKPDNQENMEKPNLPLNTEPKAEEPQKETKEADFTLTENLLAKREDINQIPGNKNEEDTIIPVQNQLPLDLGQELHRCAESVIYLNKTNNINQEHYKPFIIKHRLHKKYRIPEIEQSLSTTRMRQEVGNLFRAKKLGIPVPAIYSINIQHKLICMEYLENSFTLKDYLHTLSDEKLESNELEEVTAIFNELGACAAKLHNGSIIHGDLTSSNIMVNKDSKKIRLIDFGLSFKSSSIEDKGVDLYVFEKSLLCEQRDEKKMKELVDIFCISYVKNSKTVDNVIKRLQNVKMRGRKKVAFG